MEKKSTTQVLAVGGGKGGVGKSFVTSGLAAVIAGQGRKTLLIDLDLGAANLHTMFGLRSTERGIGDFLYAPHSNHLDDYAVDTGVPNLRLVSGNGFIPGIANLTYQQKVKILRAIQRLDTDVVLLDLGAGTSYNVVDFFSITESGILVTVAEPTAILNAYEFLKNVLFRIFSQRFKSKPEVLQVINSAKINPGDASNMENLARAVGAVDPAAEALLRDIGRRFRPGLIINMNRGMAENLGQNLRMICRNFLGLEVEYLGAVPSDPKVQDCFLRMKQVVLEFPKSAPSEALRDIARECLSERWRFRPPAALEDAPEVVEAAPSEAPAEVVRNAALEKMIAGHKDADLSGLLSRFLDEYSKESSAAKPSAGASEATRAFSLLDFESFEPRMSPAAKIPVFASVADFNTRCAKGSWMDRLVFHRREIHSIRSIPQSENIFLAIEQAGAGKRNARTPEIGWAWLETGFRLLESHKFSGACRAFGRAQACLPREPVVLNNCAAALLIEGSIKAAFEMLNEALARRTDNPFLLYNAGLACFMLDRFEESVACFSKLDGVWRAHPPAFALSGYALYRLGRHADARSRYESVLGREPKNLEARWNIGLCNLREKRYLEAHAFFSDLLLSAPEDAEALAARGLVAWQVNRKAEAVQDFALAIRKQPANLSFRSLRGVAAYLAGQYDKAIEDIEIITRLVPDNRACQALLLDIRKQLGVE